jgi:hypothetical protein
MYLDLLSIRDGRSCRTTSEKAGSIVMLGLRARRDGAWICRGFVMAIGDSLSLRSLESSSLREAMPTRQT